MGNGDPGGLPAGTRFGHYEIRRLLGKGGMGEVYEAYDTDKGRSVALKLLRAHLGNDTVYQERFKRESRTAARLQEPHVIPIHHWGEIDGVLFIDMRLVKGKDLRSLLRTSGPLSPSRAVAIISQIASALDAAHADNLVHRDVKPENILVTADDFAYLVDFGIAHSTADTHLTEMGSAVGSYAYMAPERFDDAPVTGEADVYSLACVLYECLTGASPYAASTIRRIIMAHISAPPPRPSLIRAGVPEALDAVIARGLAKDPDQRFPTAGALARAAAEALTAPSPSAPTVVPGGPVIGRSTAPPTIAQPVPRHPAAHFPPPPPQSAPPRQSVPPQAAPPQWAPPQSSPPPRHHPPPPAQHQRSVLPIVLAVVVVGVVLAGILGWFLFNSLSSDDSGSTTTTIAEPTLTDSYTAPPTTDAVASLPPGAQPCPPTVGQTGEFSRSARGTTVTSCPFAEETRISYARSGPASTQSRVIDVYSPVTSQTYQMTCVITSAGPLVTCTGGNDAIVYLY